MKLQIIGDPVLHSLSPKIQGAMLRELGLDLEYTAHVVKKGELSNYFKWASANGVIGFNATMPHKEDLLPLLDEVSGDAARCGAVNTVCLRGDKWIGNNTDGEGALAAVKECGMWPAKTVVVLGAGGAAKAVALKLASSGAEKVWVCNRTLAKAEALCTLPNMTPAGFDRETLSTLCAEADLLVNATNLGMESQPQFETLEFINSLPIHAGVFDVIYHPAETELLKHAAKRGLNTCNGLPMLIHQAIFALEHFLDRPLDHENLGRVIRSAL